MIQPEMKLIVSFISLGSFWQEWNFVSLDKRSCKHYPKWNNMKGNICACLYFIKTKIIGFYWMGRFSWTTPEAKFHFVLPAMKSNINRISFMVGENFISGRFHFGSHVKTLLDWFFLLNEHNDQQNLINSPATWTVLISFLKQFLWLSTHEPYIYFFNNRKGI